MVPPAGGQSAAAVGQPHAALTPLQLYCFETSGYVLLRGVLGAPQRARIAAAIERGGQEVAVAVGERLAKHPVLRATLTELMDDPDVEALVRRGGSHGSLHS